MAGLQTTDLFKKTRKNKANFVLCIIFVVPASVSFFDKVLASLLNNLNLLRIYHLFLNLVIWTTTCLMCSYVMFLSCSLHWDPNPILLPSCFPSWDAQRAERRPAWCRHGAVISQQIYYEDSHYFSASVLEARWPRCHDTFLVIRSHIFYRHTGLRFHLYSPPCFKGECVSLTRPLTFVSLVSLGPPTKPRPALTTPLPLLRDPFHPRSPPYTVNALLFALLLSLFKASHYLIVLSGLPALCIMENRPPLPGPGVFRAKSLISGDKEKS